MKKNKNRFPIIRGRILESNIDEHIADNKFLINADACKLQPRDIVKTLKGDGLTVSVNGKWITVHTNPANDAKAVAKSIRKVCKGRYLSFVINDKDSHVKAAHNKYIKVDESLASEKNINNKMRIARRKFKTINEGIVNEMLMTAAEDTYEQFAEFLQIRGDIKLPDVYNLSSYDEIIDMFVNNYPSWLEFSKGNAFRFMEEDEDYGKYYSTVRFDVSKSYNNKNKYGNRLGGRRYVNEGVNNIYDDMVFTALEDSYEQFAEYMYNKKVFLPDAYSLDSFDDFIDVIVDNYSDWEIFTSNSGFTFMEEDEDYGKYYTRVKALVSDEYINRNITNESKNDSRTTTINKIEGYFIGKGTINGNVNKSTLINATINEGIKNLIENEKDSEQKRLMESFEKWALFKGKNMINESELVNINSGSNVDAHTRKQLFESAINNRNIKKYNKLNRSSRISKIKKYL